MPISASDIQNVVLQEDDFGHEMRVGGIFTNIKFPAINFSPARFKPLQHGGTYIDPVTQKTRQFDYRFHITERYDDLHNIFLAAECKNLNPDLPLVVCGRPRTDEEAYHLFIARGEDEKSQIRKVEGPNSLYKPNDFVGKSIVRLKKKDNKLCSDGDSEIYDKWSQALASSHDLAFGAVYKKPLPKSLAFVMPLVVVPDNSLWTVSYRNDGTLESSPQQVDQCEFYVDQKLLIGLPFVLTHIHFVTLKGLSQTLFELANTDSYKWDKIFSITSSNFNP